ncbi:MAG TPA: flagellar biosynthesis protein FlhB [Candidatus Methylomirabilis sp.]|nr:flagellar biosynthesis protein FlhB [Candidatus Methylomirabilis sp.]
MAEEKSQAPTPRRRQEARRRGQVAKSVEVNTAVVLLFSFVAIRLLSGVIFQALSENLTHYLSEAGGREVTAETAVAIFLPAIRAMFIASVPVILVALAAGTTANLLQSGFLFSIQPLKPDLGRINPIAGAKRLTSVRALFDLVKAILKLVLLMAVFWASLNGALEQILALAFTDPKSSWVFIPALSFEVALKSVALLVVLAIIDYLWQRYQMLKQLRMSPKEMRDEYRETEGDPLLRRRIRERGRALASKRMMAEVPQADVVITNPTEIAIALRYDAAKMNAPFVVAKGERLIAKRIRQIAEEHKVPIVENPPLAQTLNRLTELGDEIPGALYQAVAEVLAFVYRLKGVKVGR